MSLYHGINSYRPTLWEIGLVDSEGRSLVEYAHCVTRSEAISRALQGKDGWTVETVVRESVMTAEQIAKARESVFDEAPRFSSGRESAHSASMRHCY